MNGYNVVNVLSESSFLLWWSFGLWGTVRFLREGRFFWLPPAIGFGGTRLPDPSRGDALAGGPGGDIAHPAAAAGDADQLAAVVARLVFVLGGLLFLVGPYIAIKGGLGTMPGIARVLGLEEQSQPLGPGA